MKIGCEAAITVDGVSDVDKCLHSSELYPIGERYSLLILIHLDESVNHVMSRTPPEAEVVLFP